MDKPRCKFDGCDKPSRKRGWCDMHYWRWKRNGDPAIRSAATRRRGPRRSVGNTDAWRKSFEETLSERVDKDGPGGCWLWTGRLGHNGYGALKRDHQHWLAHRYVYTNLIGPIPDDLELDHLCRVRSCVNPSHLEPVTGHENRLRGESNWARMMRTGRCKNGHEMTEDNTYTPPTRPTNRRCRTCARERRKQSAA